MAKGTKGRKCNFQKADGSFCSAWALRVAEEDGSFRCTGHSERPDAIARRRVNTEMGRVLGGRKKRSDNKASAESILADFAAQERAERAPERPLKVCPRCGYPKRVDAVWPDGIDLSNVTGSTGQNAWREAVFENMRRGAITEAEARTFTAIIRDAGTAKPPTPGEGEVDDENSPLGVLRSLNRALAGQAGGET